eukprot:Skav203796  [mRNA]  locus=scaffold206:607794:622700:+ [translate_table: standard]
MTLQRWKQQENLTQQQEASRAAEVRRERAHADAQREEAQNVERSAWLEAHQGQVKPINVHSINLAEQEVADAEQQEQAAADAHALSEMRQRLEQSKLATAEAITKATEELRTEQEAQLLGGRSSPMMAMAVSLGSMADNIFVEVLLT